MGCTVTTTAPLPPTGDGRGEYVAHDIPSPMRNPTAPTVDGCKGAGMSGGTVMLGIDVSKARLTCTLLTSRDQPPLWQANVPNTPAGIAQILAQTAPTCPWVVEPTGIYSRAVVAEGQAAGRPVLLAQPKRAKDFLASRSPRAKTDRGDSYGLACYGLAATLLPFPLKSAAMDQLDQLQTARKGISDALARLRQQRAVLPAAAAALTAAISGLAHEQAALDAEIAARARQEPLVATLDAVPGIGPVTATAVASCLTSKQFAHPDQFVAYIGLDVRVRESGQRRGQRTLTHQGDAELRRLLYLCALANVRSRDTENPFKVQYERERAKGLATTAAVCAVARKLARVCWSLARHGTQYEATRVHQQPRHEEGHRNLEDSNTP
jgi:transposase